MLLFIVTDSATIQTWICKATAFTPIGLGWPQGLWSCMSLMTMSSVTEWLTEWQHQAGWWHREGSIQLPENFVQQMAPDARVAAAEFLRQLNFSSSCKDASTDNFNGPVMQSMLHFTWAYAQNQKNSCMVVSKYVWCLFAEPHAPNEPSSHFQRARLHVLIDTGIQLSVSAWLEEQS